MSTKKWVCPNCKQKIDGPSVVEKRNVKLVLQFRCHSCQAWIGLHPPAEYLRLVGFSVLLICSVAGFFVQSDTRTWVLAVGFVGACIGFFGFKAGKFVAIEVS